MYESRAELKALAGLKRCNRAAAWYSPVNGYQLCDQCCEMEPERTWMIALAEAGPSPFGRCDRALDGMGAAYWPKRVRAAVRS